MAERSLSVAVVRPYLTRSKGGAERYALEVIGALAAAGHRVRVFAHSWERPQHSAVAYTKVSMPRKPAWLRVLAFHFNLRRVLRPAEFDVILGMTPFFPQQVFWLGDGLYRKWVESAWPLTIVRRFMVLKRTVMAVNLAFERRMLSPATDGFIANSNLVASQARRHYGVPPDRIAIVPPCIDEERFNPAMRARWRDPTRRELGILDDEIVFLFASHNFRRKGLAAALEALARMDLSGKRIHLLAAGAGPVEAFRRRATRLGVAERVQFLGAVPDMERYYAAADAFVLPTQYDPCAAVCLEAMACGLPVITTDMNGASEFIENGATGFVLPAHAPAEALARCMTICTDGSWRSRAGGASAARIRGLGRASHAARLCAAVESFARRHAVPAMLPLATDLAANDAFLPLLLRHRLNSCAALLDSAKRELEYNQNKKIALLTLEEPGETRRFFIKSRRLGPPRLGIFASAPSAAKSELRKILALRAAGIPTMEPAAAGERVLSDGSRESFLMTLCLDGYLPADQYIKEYLAAPSTAAVRRAKHKLGRSLADLAARMHAHGFHHRDFYLCHIFVWEHAADEPDIKLIDLERAGRHSLMRQRWAVKDLAQIHYSSLEVPVSDWDRLRFFARYCAGIRRERRRGMLRRILRKSRAIARHDARLRVFLAPATDPFAVATIKSSDSNPPNTAP